MQTFIGRVELNGATESDYEILHKAMAKIGFMRHIKLDDGTTRKLPTATYAFRGDSTAIRLTAQATIAANSTNKTSMIIVIDSNHLYTAGLPIMTDQVAAIGAYA